jgi:hypothetical protein
VYFTSVPTEDDNANKTEKPDDSIDVAWIIGWGDVDDIGWHVVWR